MTEKKQNRESIPQENRVPETEMPNRGASETGDRQNHRYVDSSGREKESVLGVYFDTMPPHKLKEVCENALLQDGTCLKVYTPNPEIVMKANRDDAYCEVLNRAGLLVPDGIGVVIASKMKGGAIQQRQTGIDLLAHLLSVARSGGKRVFLLGSKPGVAEKARDHILEAYYGIKIVGVHHGYFTNDDEVLPMLREAKPDLLVVALGAPKQEIFIDKYAKSIGASVAIGVGGALDVWSGDVKRAPKWISKIGMEWLYRGLSQPSRLPRLLSLPTFLIKVAYSKWMGQ